MHPPARVTSLDGKADLEHVECENRHVRHAYGAVEWLEQGKAQALAEYWAERAEARAEDL